MWLLPVAGLILGIVLGVFIPFTVPIAYSYYIAVVVLSLLGGLLVGLCRVLEGSFDPFSFWSGIFLTVFFAFLLIYIGENAGVDLYVAVLLALCYRIMQSVDALHALMLNRFRSNKMEKREN